MSNSQKSIILTCWINSRLRPDRRWIRNRES